MKRKGGGRIAKCLYAQVIAMKAEHFLLCLYTYGKSCKQRTVNTMLFLQSSLFFKVKKEHHSLQTQLKDIHLHSAIRIHGNVKSTVDLLIHAHFAVNYAYF